MKMEKVVCSRCFTIKDHKVTNFVVAAVVKGDLTVEERLRNFSFFQVRSNAYHII